MKSIVLVPLLLISVFYQSFAQCSNPFYQFTEGTLMETANYDEKGKFEGKQEIQVKSWSETDDGYTATIAFKLYDKKEKPVTEGEYELKCINGVIYMDMSAFIPEETLQAFKDMNMEVKMDQLEYPAELHEGQSLDDGNLVMTGNTGPMTMKFTFEITDRKVEGKETITTPAGTFECFKISQKTSSKMMISNSEFKTIQYLAEKYGAVKTETYKSNGKLMSYSLLTKFEE